LILLLRAVRRPRNAPLFPYTTLFRSQGKASMGSWLAYGLGAMNEDLPTFVVLTSKLPPVGNIQALSSSLWSSGFLPPDLSGVARSEEHTSELQSRENLVCRLLLEEKN